VLMIRRSAYAVLLTDETRILWPTTPRGDPYWELCGRFIPAKIKESLTPHGDCTAGEYADQKDNVYVTSLEYTPIPSEPLVSLHYSCMIGVEARLLLLETLLQTNPLLQSQSDAQQKQCSFSSSVSLHSQLFLCFVYTYNPQTPT